MTLQWQKGAITPHKTTNNSGYRLFWRDEQGKRHSRVIIGSKTDANIEMRKILKSLDEGNFVATKKDTFLDFAREYVTLKRGSWAVTTYNQNIKILIEETGKISPMIGDKSLQKITSQDLIKVLDQWISTGRIPMARLVYRYLSAYFNKALEMDMIKTNPLLRIPKPRPNKPEKKALTPSDWYKFYTTLDDDFSRAYFKIMVVTGLRRSEMCGLRVGDVNDDMSLSIQRGYVVSEGQGIYTDTKNHQSINIPLDATTFELLKNHIQEITGMAIAYGRGITRDEPLFPNPLSVGKGAAGKPVNPDTWSKWFKQNCKKAGLDTSFTIHELRHTTATLMIVDMGLDPLTVSKRLRHADTGFTLNQYAHLFSGAQRDASNKIGQLLR